MDLLEYQGKQLFKKHGVPVPEGRPAASVDEAVEAAEELGYPVVVKAQVQIGGRGKAGGIKLANDRAEAEEHAKAILGMDIKGLTVHELYIERASKIAEEYYAAIVFDRGEKKPMAMLSKMGGMDVEEVAEKDPEAMRMLHVDPLIGFQDFHGRRLGVRGRHRRGRDPPRRRDARQALRGVRGGGHHAGRGQPAADHRGARGGGARRQGHGGRERALPPPRHGGVPRSLRRGRAGADGQGARPDLREPRRQRGDPGQRRRPRDVHARRGGAGRRQARQLPRRRRRQQGRGDHERRRGDPLEPERERRAVQHLRRHHPLRRGGQGADRGVRADQARRAVRGAPRRHERRGGPPSCSPRPDLPNVHTEATMLGAAERVVELAG